MAARVFTLAEANRTLPLVRRVVEDITAYYPAWKDLVSKYELIAAKARPDWGESPEQLALKGRIDDVARMINACLVELEQVGCEFKGFEEGLVDFHGRLGDREILWCWKLGEPRVSHWHDLDAGFSGRQPIPEVVTQ